VSPSTPNTAVRWFTVARAASLLVKLAAIVVVAVLVLKVVGGV
jgi:hypothetical protein